MRTQLVAQPEVSSYSNHRFWNDGSGNTLGVISVCVRQTVLESTGKFTASSAARLSKKYRAILTKHIPLLSDVVVQVEYDADHTTRPAT